jgi:hypothetical protein
VTEEREAVMLSKRDKQELRHLAQSEQPLWGGHLIRGEPALDPDLIRWVALGIVKPIYNDGYMGYILTDRGRFLIGHLEQGETP